MRVRMWEIFFLLVIFFDLANPESVLKDEDCVESDTKSHYFIGTLHCLSTKVEIVATFYHKEKKSNSYKIQWLSSRLVKGKIGIGK